VDLVVFGSVLSVGHPYVVTQDRVNMVDTIDWYQVTLSLRETKRGSVVATEQAQVCMQSEALRKVKELGHRLVASRVAPRPSLRPAAEVSPKDALPTATAILRPPAPASTAARAAGRCAKNQVAIPVRGGGSFLAHDPHVAHASTRDKSDPLQLDANLGFRCAR
jgi:hypothetical protein